MNNDQTYSTKRVRNRNFPATGMLFTLVPVSMAVLLPFQQSGPEIEKARENRDGRPNILFIVSEDNGPELGCYGAPVKTPILDRLAGQGIMFRNAYVPQAGCSPSRASFLTGLYPHQHGQIGLATWDYSMYRENTPNLVNDLKRSGYRTGMIGKLHVLPESAFQFDWWETQGSNFQRNKLGHYAKEAQKFIEESDAPFYLQVNYPDAHAPFLPQVDGIPAQVLTGDMVGSLPYFGISTDSLKQKTADYYNCLMRLDHWIGDLLEILRATGKYENTMIVYIGDHGADMLRGKRTVYEGGVRIPLIISWAGGKKGIVYNDLVSTIDLYPTFMELSGNPVPGHLPGKSLMPAIRGNMAPVRDYLFTEFHVHSNHNPYPQRAVRDNRFKLIYNPVTGYENPGFFFTVGKKINREDFYNALDQGPQVIRDAYARMNNPPEFELYDLENDPFEWNNLAENPEYGKILKKMKKALVKWQKTTRDPFTDKQIAEKLFLEIVNAKEQKIEIKYHQYMDPDLKFGPQ